MSAQENWKNLYRLYMIWRESDDDALDFLNSAIRFRREAALERRCEALQRQNAALAEQLRQAQGFIANIAGMASDPYRLAQPIVDGARRFIREIIEAEP